MLYIEIVYCSWKCMKILILEVARGQVTFSSGRRVPAPFAPPIGAFSLPRGFSCLPPPPPLYFVPGRDWNGALCIAPFLSLLGPGFPHPSSPSRYSERMPSSGFSLGCPGPPALVLGCLAHPWPPFLPLP